MIAKKAQISNTICDTRIDQAFNIVVVVFCTLLVILLLYPLYFVVCASISNPSMVAKGKTLLYPVRLTTLGYEEIFKNRDIWIGYKNTIIYTVGGTFFSLLFTLICPRIFSTRLLTIAKPNPELLVLSSAE